MGKCPKCNIQFNDGTNFCSICGNKLQDNSVKQQAEQTANFTDVKKEKTKSKLIISIIAAAVAVFLIITTIIILVFVVIKPFTSKDRLSLTYLKDGEINYTSLKRIRPFEATSSFYEGEDDNDLNDYNAGFMLSYYIKYSNDCKYMFYPDKVNDTDDASLYFRKLKADNTKVDSAVKIDTEVNINNYRISENGTKVFYLKGKDGNLYLYNLKDKEKIDSEVVSFYINKSGTHVIYQKKDNSIYTKDISKKTEKEKIDSDANILNVTDDLNKVYYDKDGSLYKKEFNKDKVKISSDVENILQTYSDGSLYYVKNENKEVKLIDYVDDDLAVSDASIKEPKIEDYQTEEYNGWWTDTITDWDSYYDAKDIYLDKQLRDTLRDTLKNEKVTIENKSIYFNDGTNETKITDNVNQILAHSKEKPAVVYNKNKNSDIKKIKFSNIKNIDDVKSLLNSVTGSECFILINSKETAIDQNKAYNFVFDISGNTLYFLNDYSDEKDCGSLTELKISNEKIASANKIDDDVNLFTFRSKSSSLIYYKDVKNEIGDIYENGNRIASDVYINSLYSFENSNTLVFITDYSSNSKKGSLVILTKNKPVKIAEEVNYFVAISEKNIAYLKDYNNEKNKGDALLYNGSKKPKLIDTDVSTLIPNNYTYGIDY